MQNYEKKNPVLLRMANELAKKKDAEDLRNISTVTALSVKGKQLVRTNNKTLLNLGGNDYLGIGSRKIPQKILTKYATGGSSGKASRLLSGNHPLNITLEKKLAAWKNCDAALLVSSGYAANFGALNSLAFMESPPVFIFDRNMHASLIDGVIKAGRAKFASFKHNDLDDLQKKINKYSNEQIIVVSESIFSMDGDFAPAEDLLEISAKKKCLLFLDEAHAHGICGKYGEGVLGHIPQQKKMHLLTSGTFGKALGGSGAFLCGSSLCIDYFVNFLRPLIFSTALSPLTLACNLQALETLEKACKNNNHGDLLRKKTLRITKALESYGFITPNKNHPKWAPSPIVPIITNSSSSALQLQKKFEKLGYYVPAIRPPTVPKGSARLRLTVNNTLSMAEIVDLCNNFKKVFKSS